MTRMVMVLGAVLFGAGAGYGAMVSIASVDCVNGGLVEVPITIDEALGVGGFQFTIAYDNATLAVVDNATGTLTAGWAITSNLTGSGVIRVLGYGSYPSGLPAGGGSLLVVRFKVLGTAGQGDNLTFTQYKLVNWNDDNTTEIPCTVTSGQVSILEHGAVQVTILPIEAAAAGGQWRVAGGEWKNSGESVNALPGQQTIEFKGISGWDAPASRAVTVSLGQTAGDEGVYVQQTGFLNLTLLPAEAVAAGAMWRADGGAWLASGVSFPIFVGSRTVEFNDIPGWVKPDNVTLVVADNQTASQTVAYIERGDINNSGTVDILDVILCMRISVELPATFGGQTYNNPYPAWVTDRADRKTDGVADISDVMLILKRSVEN